MVVAGEETMSATRSSARAFSIEDAEAELAVAGEKEQELDLELEKLYSRAAHLCQSESRNLAYVSEQHKQVPAAIRRLQETLQQTSGVADELSNRVRKLDVVCSRVSEALKIVDDMLDLRECSEQVMKAITSEEFEQAAKYISRFRASQDALPPGTDDASVRVLRDAEQQLSIVVRRKFDAAMAAKDKVSVSRFAKLFHPLGLAGEGVQKYVTFLRLSLAEKCTADFRLLGRRADAGPTPYAEALMSVFVEIADIVQRNQEEVETEFGPENFIVVLRGLLEEVDTQGLRILDKFCADNKKVFEQNASCEMREVGGVLDEMAVVTMRTQQFNGYIHDVARSVVDLISDKEAFCSGLPAEHSRSDGLIELTKLMRKVQELVSSYVCVEQNFLILSVKKAIKEDTLDPTDPEQLTTTLVDDAFFVLQECMVRAISSGEINAACAVLNHVSAAIGGDPSAEIQSALMMNLSESKRLYGAWIPDIKSLAMPAAGEHPLAGLFVDHEGNPRKAVSAAHSWPHCLNNLQQCLEYIDQLKMRTEKDFDESFPAEGPDKDKRVIFQHCISQLEATKVELENLHSTSCKQGLQMLKVHLSPMMLPLDTLNYEISHSKYEDLKVNDPFAKAFITQAEVIHQHLRAVLNPVSREEIMQHMADQTCRRIEKSALSKKFSLYGALQFDTDIRALCSYFTNVSEQALRHKFARLLEMSNLLSLESIAELRELHSEVRTRRLTSEEARQLLMSRVDFNATEDELIRLLG